MILGALEAGGTKMVCAIGNENGQIYEKISIPTKTPDLTLPAIIDWFKRKPIEALGIACFGPIDLDPASDTYGYITSTPKAGWQNINICGILGDALDVPLGFDTDVNGSLLGETTFGKAYGLRDVVYFTIGTGIGAGIMSGGNLLHGMLHPEAGHMRLMRHPKDNYAGRCPFHGNNCFEGLASGPAIEERYHTPAITLADRDDVWDMEAWYIAEALCNIILTLSPKRIILGGGIIHQTQLFPLIHSYVAKKLAGYIQTDELANLADYIVPASLGDDQGVLGALVLARNAIAK